VVVQDGPQVYKSAALLAFGNRSTGKVSTRQLIFKTYGHARNAPIDEFEEKPGSRWSCKNEEIIAVQNLLNGALPDSGMYQLAQQDLGVQEFVAHIDAGSVNPEAVHRVVTAICNAPALAEALARMDEAGVLASVIERNRQLDGLQKWRHVVENPSSLEPDIQKVLDKEWWVFGGRYIHPTVRRQLVAGDQLDMALVRADGSLHVIEIKQANIPKLIQKHRNHYRVGDEVHEAVSQAANYLRSLDEHRATILADWKIDARRASATVVIGHPKFVDGRIPRDAIAETIRTYNSHLSRIEVMTFADLIEGAEGSFALAEANVDDSEVTREQESEDDPWPEPQPWPDPWDEPPF
jgi:hypothetical protein